VNRVIEEIRRGRAPLEAADRIGCTFTVAYDWIRRFNESGFGTLEADPNPRGRPPILKAQQLRDLIDVALSSPEEQGLPFSTWSVPKLAEYRRGKGLLPPGAGSTRLVSRRTPPGLTNPPAFLSLRGIWILSESSRANELPSASACGTAPAVTR
jgi:hypothetical protein